MIRAKVRERSKTCNPKVGMRLFLMGLGPVLRPNCAVKRRGGDWRPRIVIGMQCSHQMVERRPDQDIALVEGRGIATPWVRNGEIGFGTTAPIDQRSDKEHALCGVREILKYPLMVFVVEDED